MNIKILKGMSSYFLSTLPVSLTDIKRRGRNFLAYPTISGLRIAFPSR